MYYVYHIQSINHPDQIYTGYTSDIKQRLKEHNDGLSKHTSKFLPWKLICYHGFEDIKKAKEFEYYLKSGSGKAFAKKRFW